MSLLLPTDDNGNPINVLGFDFRGTQKLALVPGQSVKNPAAVPSDIEIVTIIATGPCRFETGDSTVTADGEKSAFLYPGQYLDIPLRPGERYVAFIAEDEACSAYIMNRI